MTKLKLGRYQHYKGNHYQVVGVAIHSETEEQLVVYYPCYSPFTKDDLWVRPLSMFTETVVIDEQSVPRFKYIE